MVPTWIHNYCHRGFALCDDMNMGTNQRTNSEPNEFWREPTSRHILFSRLLMATKLLVWLCIFAFATLVVPCSASQVRLPKKLHDLSPKRGYYIPFFIPRMMQANLHASYCTGTAIVLFQKAEKVRGNPSGHARSCLVIFLMFVPRIKTLWSIKGPVMMPNAASNGSRQTKYIIYASIHQMLMCFSCSFLCPHSCLAHSWYVYDRWKEWWEKATMETRAHKHSSITIFLICHTPLLCWLSYGFLFFFVKKKSSNVHVRTRFTLRRLEIAFDYLHDTYTYKIHNISCRVRTYNLYTHTHAHINVHTSAQDILQDSNSQSPHDHTRAHAHTYTRTHKRTHISVGSTCLQRGSISRLNSPPKYSARVLEASETGL
jgi:hypothetical protein